MIIWREINPMTILFSNDAEEITIQKQVITDSV